MKDAMAVPNDNPLLGTVMRKTPLDETEKGINQTWRATVRTPEGDIDAYIKRIPENEIAVEMVCAIVGRRMGIPIPQPLLVLDGEEIVFGMVAILYPDLQHTLTPKAILDVHLAGWTHLHSSSTFDEWIANTDRHGGNILTDGVGNFWLIDHGLADIEGKTPPGAPSPYNHLLKIATDGATDDLKLRRLKNSLQRIAVDSEDIAVGDLIDVNIPKTMLEFLQERRKNLARILDEKVTRNGTLA